MRRGDKNFQLKHTCNQTSSAAENFGDAINVERAALLEAVAGEFATASEVFQRSVPTFACSAFFGICRVRQTCEGAA